MRPYGLRQSIRCPKKYGEGVVKERPDMSALVGNDPDPIQPEQNREETTRKAREDRCRRNAASLPDLYPSPGDEPLAPQNGGSTAGGPPSPQEHLLIHGYTVPEYQRAYHSVVDPLLSGLCGAVRAYSLELGRTVKCHLFQELCYPTLQITEQSDGRLEVVERFCVLRSTPFVAVDMSGEPSCLSATREKNAKTCPTDVV